MGEFELIERYFAPLAGDGTFGLRNDAMLLTPPPGTSVVLTADMMVAGVHFLPEDSDRSVARKLLRVNLSDLAAMGASAHGYLVTVAWPDRLDEKRVAAFAEGLAEDQRLFGVALLGGDTVRTGGPFTVSLTAVGFVPAGQCLTRSGARPGDLVYVSGTIGDAALGLDSRLRRLPASPALEQRYLLPTPRLSLGKALLEQGLATAALDVSDGLLADLAHIAEESGLQGCVETARVPLSEAAAPLLRADPTLIGRVLAGGDDYELLFTVAPQNGPAVDALAARLGLPLTRIGDMRDGSGVVALGADGHPLELQAKGWTHF